VLRTRSSERRISSTGKVAGAGKPPAKEITSGRSVTLRISRMAELWIARARVEKRALKSGALIAPEQSGVIFLAALLVMVIGH